MVDKIIKLSIVGFILSMTIISHLDRMAFIEQLHENQKVLFVALNRLGDDVLDMKGNLVSINKKIDDLEMTIADNNDYK